MLEVTSRKSDHNLNIEERIGKLFISLLINQFEILRVNNSYICLTFNKMSPLIKQCVKSYNNYVDFTILVLGMWK